MRSASEPAARRTEGSVRTTGWLLIAAGAAGVASSPLGWARLTYPSPGPRLTVDAVGHARAGLLLGLFMLAAGVVVLAARSREVKRAWLSVGIACGIALGGLAVFDLLTERNRAISTLLRNSSRGAPLAHSAAGLVMFSFRAALFVAIAAGTAALGAAAVLLVKRRSQHKNEVPDARGDP